MNWKSWLEENSKDLNPRGVDRRVLIAEDAYAVRPPGRPFLGKNKQAAAELKSMQEYSAVVRSRVYKLEGRWPVRVVMLNHIVGYNRFFSVQMVFTFAGEGEQATAGLDAEEMEKAKLFRFQRSMFLN